MKIEVTTGYAARQALKTSESDTGLSLADFIVTVRTVIRHSSYDATTKIFYYYIELQDGKWGRIPIDTETLEHIAYASGFLGRIPIE